MLSGQVEVLRALLTFEPVHQLEALWGGTLSAGPGVPPPEASVWRGTGVGDVQTGLFGEQEKCLPGTSVVVGQNQGRVQKVLPGGLSPAVRHSSAAAVSG